MDLRGQREIRRSVESKRRAPREPERIVVPFSENGTLRDVTAGPILLSVEATNDVGDLAPWLDDAWWTMVMQRWADDAVTVLYAPTPDALLHSAVLHHVEMLRRVQPGWRIVGYAYRDDLAQDDDVSRAAVSPYHELRFFDQCRPGPPQLDVSETRALDELFAEIRRAQVQAGVTLPALVRLPAARCETKSASAPTRETAGEAGSGI